MLSEDASLRQLRPGVVGMIPFRGSCLAGRRGCDCSTSMPNRGNQRHKRELRARAADRRAKFIGPVLGKAVGWWLFKGR
jgi:hypothetical protein